MDEIAQYLEWDSNFFGKRIARANVHQLDTTRAKQLDAWCQENQIDLLYFLAESDHPQTIIELEDHQYRFVDTRVCYQKPLQSDDIVLPSLPENITTRSAVTDDLETLINISRGVFQNSRFYADQCISQQKADQFYETWINNSILNNFASDTIVALLDDEVIGYLIVKYHSPEGEGNYSLMSISPKARRKGIATIMMKKANKQFFENGLTVANVITQGNNINAQSLYQKQEMRLTSLQYWYHKWFTPC